MSRYDVIIVIALALVASAFLGKFFLDWSSPWQVCAFFGAMAVGVWSCIYIFVKDV